MHGAVMPQVVETLKFRLNPEKEARAVLSRYAKECQRIMNHVFRDAWMPFSRATNYYALNAKHLRAENPLSEKFDLRAKAYYEALLVKVSATIQKRGVLFKRPFIVCRSRMGRIRREDGKYVFGIKHPYEKGWLEMPIEPGHGKSDWRKEGIRKMEALVESKSDFPSYEMHRNRFGGWILHISLQGMEAEVESHNIMGVDVGIRNNAVAVVRGAENSHVATRFWKGSEFQAVMRRFQARKKEIQEQKKSKRLEVSGWTNAYLNKVAKEMVDFAVANSVSVIRFEDLRAFRPAKVSPGKGGKMERQMNRMLGSWQRGALLRAVEQKAMREGIKTEEVPAANTSRTCPKCGQVREAYSDAMFDCSACGYVNNRDWVGAWNICGGGVSDQARNQPISRE